MSAPIDCTLNKVLPADAGPLVSSWWTCSICDYSKPGGPPATCGTDNPDCPLG